MQASARLVAESADFTNLSQATNLRTASRANRPTMQDGAGLIHAKFPQRVEQD